MPDRFLLIKKHAAERMLERRIALAAVLFTLDAGVTIERYPDDTPLPSRLMLGWTEGRPIHVVVAEEPETFHIVTVYEPDPDEWSADFTTRRRT